MEHTVKVLVFRVVRRTMDHGSRNPYRPRGQMRYGPWRTVREFGPGEWREALAEGLRVVRLPGLMDAGVLAFVEEAGNRRTVRLLNSRGLFRCPFCGWNMDHGHGRASNTWKPSDRDYLREDKHGPEVCSKAPEQVGGGE